MKNKLSKGFTLIELLVVIAIIGILATLLILQLNTARSKGRDAKRVADVNQIQTAVELYYDSTGSYPQTLTDLDSGTYFQSGKHPKDPQGAEYTYKVPGANAQKYEIVAKLENNNASALGSDADFTGGEWSGAVTGADTPDFLFDVGIK